MGQAFKNYDRAKAAYEAYSLKAGGKSLVTGDPLPTFDVLKQEVQDAWAVAADAAANFEQDAQPCLDTGGVTLEDRDWLDSALCKAGAYVTSGGAGLGGMDLSYNINGKSFGVHITTSGNYKAGGCDQKAA